MSKISTRQLVMNARERLRNSRETLTASLNEPNLSVCDRLPAADIHTSSGAGREIIKRIAAKEVDPKRCRPWVYHNRDSSWFNLEKCKDLIESISKNGQLEPSLVRIIKDDPSYDYEIIYGVRRWFACSQIPNQKLLVKITDADDKQCSILMHVENADSQDISDFERAYSFSAQLKAGIFKNQTDMAKELGLTQGYVAKMVGAAKIYDYDFVKSIFPSKIGVSIRNAYKLNSLINNPDHKIKVMEVCKSIISDNIICISNSAAIFKKIFKYCSSSSINKLRTINTILTTAKGKPIIYYECNDNGLLKVVFDIKLIKLGVDDIDVSMNKIKELIS